MNIVTSHASELIAPLGPAKAEATCRDCVEESVEPIREKGGGFEDELARQIELADGGTEADALHPGPESIELLAIETPVTTAPESHNARVDGVLRPAPAVSVTSTFPTEASSVSPVVDGIVLGSLPGLATPVEAAQVPGETPGDFKAVARALSDVPPRPHRLPTVTKGSLGGAELPSGNLETGQIAAGSATPLNGLAPDDLSLRAISGSGSILAPDTATTAIDRVHSNRGGAGDAVGSTLQPHGPAPSPVDPPAAAPTPGPTVDPFSSVPSQVAEPVVPPTREQTSAVTSVNTPPEVDGIRGDTTLRQSSSDSRVAIANSLEGPQATANVVTSAPYVAAATTDPLQAQLANLTETGDVETLVREKRAPQALEEPASGERLPTHNEAVNPTVERLAVDTSSSQVETVSTSLGVRPLNQQVQQAVQQALLVTAALREQSLKVQLDPPHLGQMEIAIERSGDALQVRMAFSQAESMELVGAAVDQLKAVLAESGVEVNDFDLAHGAFDESSSDTHSPESELGERTRSTPSRSESVPIRYQEETPEGQTRVNLVA